MVVDPSGGKDGKKVKASEPVSEGDVAPGPFLVFSLLLNYFAVSKPLLPHIPAIVCFATTSPKQQRQATTN